MGPGTALTSLFKLATKDYVDSLVRHRDGETKLGQRVKVLASLNELSLSSARYVLVGVPEDVGVRANLGVGGAQTLWEPALQAILNIQNADGCRGEDLIVLGAFDFSAWLKVSESMLSDRLRNVVTNIDEAVYPLIERIIRAGKIPIVIGGGHNNAYPLLKGASKAHGKAVNCINLDAHSDYRAMEGRHSGNPFRYAKHDGFLNKYAMVGLHRGYNSEAVMNDLKNDESFHFTFYEDIFLEEKSSFYYAVIQAIQHASGEHTGIELDLDSIEGVLSSAATPSGVSVLNARQYLNQCMKQTNVAYVHITEGATELRDGRRDMSVAKLVAYLVGDVMSARP